MSEWAVIHTFAKGKPSEKDLIDLDDAIERNNGGSASAGLNDRWYITSDITADCPGNAVTRAGQRMFRAHGIRPMDAVSVEVLTWIEMENRASQPTMPELLGAAEVADLLGVSRQRVHQLSLGPNFPEPLVRVRMGPLWGRSAIESFAKQWIRKPGRPIVEPEPTVRMEMAPTRSRRSRNTPTKRITRQKQAPRRTGSVAAKK